MRKRLQIKLRLHYKRAAPWTFDRNCHLHNRGSDTHTHTHTHTHTQRQVHIRLQCVCSAYFFRAHHNVIERSHGCRSGGAFQERCVCSSAEQTCSQVSEVQVQVKSQVFEVKSKSSLKSLKRSPSQVLSLWGGGQVTSQVFVLFISNSSFSLLLRLNQFWNTDFTIWFSQQQKNLNKI